MAKPILSDALWALLEPHVPPPKKRRRRYPGRKAVPPRAALTGILFVLKTGIAWERLPQEMDCGCGMTCWRRLRGWQRRGVWKKLHRVLLQHLQEAAQIDWSRAVVDAAAVRAIHGGKKPAAIRRIAGKKARNTMC